MGINLSQARSFFVRGINLAANLDRKVLIGAVVVVPLVGTLAKKIFELKKKQFELKKNIIEQEFELLGQKANKYAKEVFPNDEKNQTELYKKIKNSVKHKTFRRDPVMYCRGLLDALKTVAENNQKGNYATFCKMYIAENQFLLTRVLPLIVQFNQLNK